MSPRDSLRHFIETELMIGEDVTLGDHDDLLVDGIIDSLGVVRLVGFVESMFGVRIPPEEMVVDNFRTIAVLGDHIEARNGSASG